MPFPHHHHFESADRLPFFEEIIILRQPQTGKLALIIYYDAVHHNFILTYRSNRQSQYQKFSAFRIHRPLLFQRPHFQTKLSHYCGAGQTFFNIDVRSAHK